MGCTICSLLNQTLRFDIPLVIKCNAPFDPLDKCLGAVLQLADGLVFRVDGMLNIPYRMSSLVGVCEIYPSMSSRTC